VTALAEKSFRSISTDVLLHLAEVKAYKSGMVGIRYEVQRLDGKPKSHDDGMLRRNARRLIACSIRSRIQ
jgi:hypothetical protein